MVLPRVPPIVSEELRSVPGFSLFPSMGTKLGRWGGMGDVCYSITFLYSNRLKRIDLRGF